MNSVLLSHELQQETYQRNSAFRKDVDMLVYSSTFGSQASLEEIHRILDPVSQPIIPGDHVLANSYHKSEDMKQQLEGPSSLLCIELRSGEPSENDQIFSKFVSRAAGRHCHLQARKGRPSDGRHISGVTVTWHIFSTDRVSFDRIRCHHTCNRRLRILYKYIEVDGVFESLKSWNVVGKKPLCRSSSFGQVPLLKIASYREVKPVSGFQHTPKQPEMDVPRNFLRRGAGGSKACTSLWFLASCDLSSFHLF